jgi:hypothetical protein
MKKQYTFQESQDEIYSMSLIDSFRGTREAPVSPPLQMPRVKKSSIPF